MTYFRSIDWRFKRMRIFLFALTWCPSRLRLRLFDLAEVTHFLDIDHLEDVANEFPEFYEQEAS